MKKKQFLNIFIGISVVLTIILALLVLFQISLDPILIKSLLFFGFSSTISLLMYLLMTQCHTCPPRLEKLLFYVGFSLIISAFIIFFGWFGASILWHTLIGAGVIYLLMVELQLLGWTNIKQSILIKITFGIALVSNIFLASIFLFKMPAISLKPLIFSATTLSILCLFYGIYHYQPKQGIKKKG